MSIELTLEEKSKLKSKDAYAQALKDFQSQIAGDLKAKRVKKSGAKRPDTLKKIEDKANKTSEKMVESFRKGWMF